MRHGEAGRSARRYRKAAKGVAKARESGNEGSKARESGDKSGKEVAKHKKVVEQSAGKHRTSDKHRSVKSAKY